METSNNEVYTYQDSTVSRVNSIEPLSGKETYMTHNNNSVFWPESKTNGLSTPEVIVDDPVRKALDENKANEQQRYGHSSFHNGSTKKQPPSTDPNEDYEAVALPVRGDSRKRLTGSESRGGSDGTICGFPARTVVIVVVIVMLIAAIGIIAGAIAATHETPQPCNQFSKVENKLALATEPRLEVTSNDTCAQTCLLVPYCSGYDWDRVRKECYLMRGVVDADDEIMLQPAPTTDHFVRSSPCEKSREMEECYMLHSKNGNIKGGISQGRRTREECNNLCLAESGCMGVDFGISDSSCYMHLHSDSATDNACCEHYSKVCQRCAYTQELNVYAPAAREFGQLRTATECASLCDVIEGCTGFDFQFIPQVCSLVYIKDFHVEGLNNAVSYRKRECFDIKAPT